MTSVRITHAFVFLSALAQAQQYVIFTYAGGAPPPTPAPSTDLPVQGGGTLGVATDAAGNTYFTGFHCVFKLVVCGAQINHYPA